VGVLALGVPTTRWTRAGLVLAVGAIGFIAWG